MNVYFFDHNTICLVCGKKREWCICGKVVYPCTCNPSFCVGGGRDDCPTCHGRGWIEDSAAITKAKGGEG